MEHRWGGLLRDGVQTGTVELLMPDGPRLRVDYSATANVEPGRHLALFVVPPTGGDVRPERSEAQQLTAREREVLARVAMGESGAVISHVLGISRGTVESHVRNCLAKLGAKNRAHAIALALRHGDISMSLTPWRPD